MLYNLVAGGGTSRAALLAVGVVPYICARLYVWLGRSLSPSIRARTDDATTKAKVIRGLTVGIAAVQSYGYVQMVSSIPNAVTNPGAGFVARTVVLLTGGAIVASLLAEQMLTNPSRDDDTFEAPTEATVNATRGAPALIEALAEAPIPLLLEGGVPNDARPLAAREAVRIPQ